MNISLQYVHKISKETSSILHLIRSLAAFTVVVNHCRGHFFVSYTDLNVESQNIFNYILFAFTRMGHEAVIIFFVLSGYLVGGQLYSNFLLKKLDLKKYILDRITRMWIVVIPALLLGGMLDYYTLQMRGINFDQSTLNVTTFLGNLSFLQTISVPVFGINSPLWSLAYEFWYYIFGAVVILILKFRIKAYFRICFLLVALLAFYCLSKDILLLFPLWILGIFCRIKIVGLKNSSAKNISYFLLTIFLCTFCLASQYENRISDYILSISFALFLISINVVQFKSPKNLGKLYLVFSSFSFTLYAIHYPLVFFIFELLKLHFSYPIRIANANFTTWAILFIITCIVYSMSYLLFLFTESKTKQLRQWINL